MAGIWRKTLIYLGLVEDDELDDYAYEDYEPEHAEAKPSVRRINHDRQQQEAVVRPMRSAPQASGMHLVHPSSFNDAQEVGDKFRDGMSVIMNLQASDDHLARRLVDFASGLAYGLGGSIQPVADKVFLVTPAGIHVSAEERRRFLEERGFFNQA
ncbi:MAG: cell division protein SepF [Actinomycetota bacterium]